MRRLDYKQDSDKTLARGSAAPMFHGVEWLALGVILLLTVLAYMPAMHGGVLWDDDAHITRPELQSLHGLIRIWTEPAATQQYYPLLNSVFWVEHRLWGDLVFGYHAASVFWHLLAVVLVYVILKTLGVPGALIAAAVFALHPVMVESVAWISEQKNTLSAVFYLSAMLAYLKFDASRRRSWYWMALGLFVLGLLTKTVTASLPAALLVIFWWQRGQLSWKRDVLPLVPFFLLGAVAGLVTAWIERKLVGAEGAGFEMTVVERGLLAGRVVWFYLMKLVWPVNLMFIYPRWQVAADVWWQWIFPFATLGTTVALWSLRRLSRAPLAAWLFFLGTLFPALGFLNVYPFLYSFVADHFQYLASLGLIAFGAASVTQLLATLSPPVRYVASGLGWCILGMLGFMTWQQAHLYADSLTLYTATIDRNPDCWLAYNNLGNVLEEAGDLDGALANYREARRLNPKSARVQNNLCIALETHGMLTESLESGRAAVSLNPHEAEYSNNLAHVLARLGQFQEAREHAERAVRLRPAFAPAHYNLALALAGVGDRAGAIKQLELAAKLRPDANEVQSKLRELRGQKEK